MLCPVNDTRLYPAQQLKLPIRIHHKRPTSSRGRHLGNARLSFADLNANSIVDVPGDILQENHYYPFGMNMNYGWMNAAALDNRYQYNGKELNGDFGLNWNDYGARWYEMECGSAHRALSKLGSL